MNSHRAMRNYELCQKFARYSQMVIKIVPTIYCSTCLLYLIPSYIQYIRSGNYTPSLTIYLPGLDANQLLHVIALELINLATAIVNVFIVIVIDSHIYIVLINLTMISRIITSELNEFEAVLRDGIADGGEIKRRLTKIILMHKHYNE